MNQHLILFGVSATNTATDLISTYNINNTIFILENFSRCIKKARVNHSGIIFKKR